MKRIHDDVEKDDEGNEANLVKAKKVSNQEKRRLRLEVREQRRLADMNKIMGMDRPDACFSVLQALDKETSGGQDSSADKTLSSKSQMGLWSGLVSQAYILGFIIKPAF